jgi:hypothetical protein
MKKSLNDRINNLAGDVICEIRKEIVRGLPATDPHVAIMAELEKELGERSPRKTKVCGSCRGCRFYGPAGNSTMH